MQEMYLEARCNYQQAEALILEELEQAPESQMLLKRQVALEKTKGNLAGAIEVLRTYVETFQTDKEAWEELGCLYLEVCAVYVRQRWPDLPRACSSAVLQ